MLEIIPFEKQYANAFYKLNIEWLESYFYVEPLDKEVLSNPEIYIINKGGFIFFVRLDNKIVGTVALMPTTDRSILELTKMAISPTLRGQNMGQKLMQHCIDFAKEQNLKSLILYTNSKLKNAIHIYSKYGFVNVPVEENSPYTRGDIKMILDL
ncbi:GNAT family N-acetyltransferase [Bizionia argentinensis]|nr:GNAT family N-acetyltransferase [Bizionia argentinensis]